ncbi:ABC transporter substrate-binding protein [Salinigranum halophilum]|jgi:branched-chain amino acid transport system substrate-binding protein|uniref:ABC transporter substrate-binding protein n=1 Tax=Salinigranum halophilum TaxID=2565931 RepID=UPI00115D55A1|nr:ABC transporter substrate-binding protein [Salinigranum halophilum]
MSTPDGTLENADTSSGGLSRRRALQILSSSVALTGLAGCVRDAGEGGSGTESGSEGGSDTEAGAGSSGTDTEAGATDIGTLSLGVLVPTSGPSAPLGKAQRQGAELGVQFVTESDAFDFEVDAVYEDTQTDPATGRQKAQKVVEEDGVQIITGALESSVSLAVADYVGQQETLYMSGAATVALTGEDCNANTFRYESNAAQHMAGLTDFAASELGTNWWLHSTDEAYGQSALNQLEQRVDEQDLDVDVVGRTMPDPGTSDFGPQISQISSSDADVLVLPETGGDLINFMKQANSAGLKDELDIIGTALFAQVSRGALGQVAAGTYSSTLYSHKLDTGDNRQFVEAYQNAYDTLPGNFARVGYELVRTAARGVQAAGTSDHVTVRDTLEGLEMQTVLGETSYRACDHQSVNPVWTGEIVEAGEGTEVNLLNKIDGPETVRSCEETGCSF